MEFRCFVQQLRNENEHIGKIAELSEYQVRRYVRVLLRLLKGTSSPSRVCLSRFAASAMAGACDRIHGSVSANRLAS